jgi:hypothetical protein
MKIFFDKSKDEILELSEKKNVPPELVFTIFSKVPEILIGTLDNLFKKSILFSRWTLAGSITATFTVIASLKELMSFYQTEVLKWFLICQVLSMFSGALFLLRNEIKEAAINSLEGKIDLYLIELKEIIFKHTSIEQIQNKEKSAEQVFDETIKNLVGRFWKGSMLYLQIVSAFVGLLAIVINALKIL